ncbi:hypothetical protein EOS_00965 [Caballeronia mineralivorans PML1(12)]|uniref:Lipoprotein n=1 Tax=Caballeronia mineralivorans PML1(12) TaxID=908627 RepID=A0A0J1G779_9BURK|nr:hypothetical protein EOS_00965 [Caballeronia mineralivorans PML1(12)]
MRHSIVCAALCNVLLLIPGCGSAPVEQPISAITHTRVVETRVAVPVPCVESVPASPVFLSDSDLLAAPNGSAVDRIWRDHLQRKEWEGVLTAQLIACAKSGVAK